MATMQLSKSDFLMFRKHPAWLWLKKHDKSKLPPPDANLQAMFDSGNLFEAIAEQRFVGLTRLGFENYQDYLGMPQRTQAALDSGSRLISQARFEYQQLTCICDVIEQVEDGVLNLYEIKASTKVKPEHIEDLAFQTIVLEGAGYTVREISVLYCNSRYTRHGEIDPEAIATAEVVTDQVRRSIASTKKEIAQALIVMQASERPDISPARTRLGGFKEWLGIYLELQPPAEPNNIYMLCRLNAQLLAELEHRGITKIADIPADVPLKPAQVRQVEANQQAEPIVQLPKIQKFLSGLEYPLYFFDYETLSSVVPPFDGLRPYQQLPFQYSLHSIATPGAELQHTEYLHTTNDNPGPLLLEYLQRDIGSRGTVLAWSDSFEKSCNSLLGQLWPEYADFIAQLNSRIQDLMTPFMKGWYVDKAFLGSASIKKVLPVVAPELSYKDMEISEGATAQRLWMQTVLGGIDEHKNELMQNLRDYCELDTLAMVRIWEFLVALSEGQGSTQSNGEQLSIF